jgi:hypothetical protein
VITLIHAGIIYVQLFDEQLLFNLKYSFMAEIHVQAKKRSSAAWLWILISIIVIAVIAFLLIWNNRDTTTNANPAQTSFIHYDTSQAA